MGMAGLREPALSPPCSPVPTEEGADPGSIELVARQVLNISLPSSPGQIQELLWEMRESISQLEGVDAVLNSTAEGLAVARDLLAKGQEARQVVGQCWGRQGIDQSPCSGRGWSCQCCCRERAEGIRDELAGTQQALEVARTQAMTAGSTLQSARDAIQVAENRAREVRSMGSGS